MNKVIYSSKTLVVSGPAITLPDENAVATYGSQGVVVQYPSGVVSTIPVLGVSPTNVAGNGNGNDAEVGSLINSFVNGNDGTRSSVTGQVVAGKPTSLSSANGTGLGGNGSVAFTSGCGGKVLGFIGFSCLLSFFLGCCRGFWGEGLEIIIVGANIICSITEELMGFFLGVENLGEPHYSVLKSIDLFGHHIKKIVSKSLCLTGVYFNQGGGGVGGGLGYGFILSYAVAM